MSHQVRHESCRARWWSGMPQRGQWESVYAHIGELKHVTDVGSTEFQGMLARVTDVFAQNHSPSKSSRLCLRSFVADYRMKLKCRWVYLGFGQAMPAATRPTRCLRGCDSAATAACVWTTPLFKDSIQGAASTGASRTRAFQQPAEALTITLTAQSGCWLLITLTLSVCHIRGTNGQISKEGFAPGSSAAYSDKGKQQ